MEAKTNFNRQDVDRFFDRDRLEPRSALLFEADTDAVLSELGVTGDDIDRRTFKKMIHRLANFGWMERRPAVDSPTEFRHVLPEMKVGENGNHGKPKRAYLDARQAADIYGFSVHKVRRWFTLGRGEHCKDGLRVYRDGRRIYTTEKDVEEFMKGRACDA